MFRWLFLVAGIVLVSVAGTLIAERIDGLSSLLPQMTVASVAALEDEKPQPPSGAFDPAMIRQKVAPRIDAGDFDALTQVVEAYYKAPQDEPIGYRAQREVFGLFAVSSPAVDKMTAGWLKASPTSPYALTARGWYLWHMGWLMRGDGLPKETYPDALTKADALFAEAAKDAEAAYQAMPDLLGASDLLILSAMHTQTAKPVPEIVDAVMKVKPNRGTLLRAAQALSPNWLGEGKTDQMMALCDAHATQVTAVPNYTVAVCRADLYYEVNAGAALAQPTPPAIPASGSWVLTKAKAQQALDEQDKSPAAKAALEHYLFDEDVTDTRAAQYLDGVFYLPGQRPLVGFDIYSRLVARATDDLVRDPLNMKLIENAVAELPPLPGHAGRKVISGVPINERFTAYRATLAAAPYSAAIWQHLAQESGTVSKGDFRAAGPFYRNAIAYANNTPYYAGSYANDLASTATMTEDGLDADQQCDFVRAVRMYQAQCPQGADGSYLCTFAFDTASWDEAMASVQNAGSCADELSADPATLTFTPEKIDWKAFGG